MKSLATFIFLIILSCIVIHGQSSNHKISQKMKINAGIITEKIQESKKFYSENLDFEVVFENDFYLLMRAPSEEVTISFLLPDHPSQQPIFHQKFEGKGMYITMEMEDVDSLYKKIKGLGTPVAFEIRDEPWGDRHFAIVDPSGIAIDLVKYTAPEE